MSDSENYETTFNHFLLYFLMYLCNFCPNTCSQQAILMKVSHLRVDTLLMEEFHHTNQGTFIWLLAVEVAIS
jgi:hypothetical protein